jgi:hypothetical protein
MNFTDFGMDTASLAGSLEAKLAAVREAGFAQVMISATDVVAHPSGVAAAAQAIRASGLRVTGYEALRDFEGLAGHLHTYKVDVAKAMLDVCGEIGSRVLLVEASASTHSDPDRDAIARDLTKLALLAIPLGIRVAFKGMPGSRTVRDWLAAWDIVNRADCPNLGFAIDSFDILSEDASAERLDVRLHVDRDSLHRGAGGHCRALPGVSGGGRAQRRRGQPGDQARRHRLRRRLQLRRLQRRLPPAPGAGGRAARARRRRVARRERAAPRSAGAQHGAAAPRRVTRAGRRETRHGRRLSYAGVE